MQEIVRQLGELFLQAVPTVLIILLFYFILRAIFFKPLLKVMAERDARTVGAQKAGSNGCESDSQGCCKWVVHDGSDERRVNECGLHRTAGVTRNQSKSAKPHAEASGVELAKRPTLAPM